MSVINDVVASYGGPHKVVARHLAAGEREDRALVILIAACVMMFVASWPYNARVAHLEGKNLSELMAGSLFALLFIAPLLFYTLSFVVGFVLRLFGWAGSIYASRMSLFWALFASTPLILLHGLVKGFLGTGLQEQIVGFIWFVVFMWFWISGLFQSARSAAQ